jgi:hypothetical protein
VRTEIVADIFVFVAADRGVPLEKAVSLAKSALDSLFHDRFRVRPDRAVTVTLWSTAAGFEAYWRTQVRPGCGDDLGEYIVETSSILVNASLGITTLIHEDVHPIVQHDLSFAPR